MAERIDGYLVAGGKWHDIDFARRELLGLLAEHDNVRIRVAADYEDTAAIAASSFLLSYTCDVRPSERAQHAIGEWVRGGGRWVALHGTEKTLHSRAEVKALAEQRLQQVQSVADCERRQHGLREVRALSGTVCCLGGSQSVQLQNEAHQRRSQTHNATCDDN